jgi:hypothetical protein
MGGGIGPSCGGRLATGEDAADGAGEASAAGQTDDTIGPGVAAEADGSGVGDGD